MGDDDRGLGVFDLVAVCDGARSRARDAMHALTKTVRPYPWGALWFIGHDRESAHAGQLRQLARGARRMVGLLPTGLGPSDGAAHATSPQLGQGCNLALIDAAALADAIDAEDTVDTALARYTTSRRAHLAYYQLATRWLTPFFQSDHDWLGALRDAVMGPACALAFVRREMVRSMAGTKTGILWGALETRMPSR
jgi:2-polyprenyl-6-methoxyphenol hydroxylase-like FAD-dependent oxidoreductase